MKQIYLRSYNFSKSNAQIFWIGGSNFFVKLDVEVLLFFSIFVFLGVRAARNFPGFHLKTKREARPGFTQSFNGYSSATNNECNVPGTCNSGSFQTDFYQTYNGNAHATNNDYGNRGKRSETLKNSQFYLALSKLNKREAGPGFTQSFNGHSTATNNECNVPGTCNSGSFQTDYYQTYSGNAHATNNDYGNRGKRSETLKNSQFYVALTKLNKREAGPGFQQTFNDQSRATNNECNAAGTCNTGSFQTDYYQTYSGNAHATNNDYSGKK
jgi:hypothetical protein